MFSNLIEEDRRERYRKAVQSQHPQFIVRYAEEEIKTPPSRYYIMDAFGFHVYVKARARDKAQAIVDEVYGKGFYKIRFVGLEPLKDNVNAR